MAKTKSKETPLMKQHNEIKARYPDAILLFRVGDFYETFGDDALIASKVLGITLTKRSNGAASSIALAGFPHHALDTYLHKLVKAGYRVAICDQLEDPKTVKGIVKRGVTELVTPGVATNDKLLEHNSNNFLAAVNFDEKQAGICFLDISTGELMTAEGSIHYIDKLLQSFQPSEVLINKATQKQFSSIFTEKYYTYAQDDWIYQYSFAYETVIKQYSTTSLKGFGIEDWRLATIAIGAAIHYLKDTEHSHLQHLTGIRRLVANDYLWMDRFTIRNLELLQSQHDKGHSLLQSIDNTLTPMGARLLKQWIVFPLTDLQKIQQRLAAVTFFINERSTTNQLKEIVKEIGDIERLVAKIPLRKVNPKELLQLQKSLDNCLAIKNFAENNQELCSDWDENEQQVFEQLTNNIAALSEVRELIDNTIDKEAPAQLHKGKVITEGVNEELDDLRNIAYKGKDYLLQIQQRESEATGISSLKIGFNNVFGYYLEVTNTHKDKVPEAWIRKQTLTNAERYITDELKQYEEKILGAEDKIAVLESQLYNDLLDQLMAYLQPMQQNAKAIASIDCLLSLETQAVNQNYCQPNVVKDKVIDIKDGRHPVIEQHLPTGQQYIPNDLALSPEQQQIIILTGPNMSGKSAVLRQVALITLLAHMGSYVPSKEATIGLTDTIYTRVGASDNLSGGESTFMVEMNETASILNNLTNRSLIILDEIGRGTSTYDGISIAWSIVEYLHQNEHHPFTLFATHYHELNELENKLERVKNYHITHKEVDNNVIFLRKLKKGGSHHSFGIQVAQMAGMPKELIQNANKMLHHLESQRGDDDLQQRIKELPTQEFQLNIFDGVGEDLRIIKDKLYETDINTLTPVEALLKLNELKEIIKNYQV